MNRQKIVSLLVTTLWVAAVWLQPATVQAEENDDITNIKVNIVTSPTAPPRILRRIEASVKTIGERLLLGRKAELLRQSPQTYEMLMQEVLDRVLSGYTVKKVTVVPGTVTVVTVELDPWGERVRDVKVDIEFSAVDPLIAPMLRQELGDLETSVSAILLGMPIDSLEWADTVAKKNIRELVEERLPEYRAAVDIHADEHAKVKIVFSPVGSVVREVKLSLRSDSMPNLLLYDMRPRLEVFAKALRGLPTAFVERKQIEFLAKLEERAAAHPYTTAYRLQTRAELTAGADTEILLYTESRSYRINAEALLDLGREDANTSGKLHAGKYISSEDEVFVEVGLVTNTMKWQVSPGWGRRVGPDTVVGARFNVTDNIRYAWLEHRFSRNWQIRFDRSSEQEDDEIGLRYKLHDFLSAELVHRPHENFIRVIGQL